ncbi:hypothetical protein L1049_016223 [Liquidambar formosana]|uniref:Uncharacterized protein n=1 Tax=Liquidambar formosana TaxID=63359 RepID=A0AAP0X6N3_LIQFO
MKVHPLPKKRSIATFSEPSRTLLGTMTHQQKKLRRLPHIFSRVLELPLKSDADVSVEESSDCFKFVAFTEGVCDVRAHTIEIHPGVVKIVIGGNGDVELLQLNELELDMWRFRLPASTMPERASAVCVDGELVVTVPKAGEVGGGEEELWGRVGRLVLVQRKWPG